MKTPIETIRISKYGKKQLVELRRQTGIENWNVLCRLAFCVSIRDEAPPPQMTQSLDGGVEMTWEVFAGNLDEIYSALTLMRVHKDGFKANPEGISDCLRAHIHRGIACLASCKEIKSLSDLVDELLNFNVKT